MHILCASVLTVSSHILVIASQTDYCQCLSPTLFLSQIFPNLQLATSHQPTICMFSNMLWLGNFTHKKLRGKLSNKMVDKCFTTHLFLEPWTIVSQNRGLVGKRQLIIGPLQVELMRAKDNVTQADAGTSIAGSISVERVRIMCIYIYICGIYIYMYICRFLWGEGRRWGCFGKIWEDSNYPKILILFQHANILFQKERLCVRKPGFCAQLCDQCFLLLPVLKDK